VSAQTRTRLVTNNQIVMDMADFYEADGYTRVPGLTIAGLTSQVFFQNEAQPWPLVPGLGVTDAQVASGRIYWSEVAGMPGFYNVRWRPNAVGFWRIILSYPTGLQIVGQEYDVVKAASETATGGLKPSFMKPTC